MFFRARNPHDKYPYALVSSGRLSTHGAFLLGSLDDPSALDHGIDSLEFQKALRPGSLASNSPAKPAIELQGAPVRITGNAVSVGTIALAPGVLLEGLKEEGHKPVGLPEINLKDLDPSAKSVLLSLSEGVIEGRREITGFARRQGDLRIEGDLVLKEGLLYVDGNLTVTGKISGLGCLVVTGTSHFSNVSLASLDQLALLSRGDLTIQGPGRERSTLVGLLYSEGNLTLSGVTVVGAIVCAGTSESALTLTNVTALTSPKGVEFEIFESFASTQSRPFTVSGGFSGDQSVIVRLKPVSDPNSPDGKRDARPADFAPPKLFDKEIHLEALDANTGAILSNINPGIVEGADEHSKAWYKSFLSQLPDENPGQVAVFAEGKIRLELNRFLRPSDRQKVVFRKTHYGSPSDPTGTS